MVTNLLLTQQYAPGIIFIQYSMITTSLICPQKSDNTQNTKISFENYEELAFEFLLL